MRTLLDVLSNVASSYRILANLSRLDRRVTASYMVVLTNHIEYYTLELNRMVGVEVAHAMLSRYWHEYVDHATQPVDLPFAYRMIVEAHLRGSYERQEHPSADDLSVQSA